ncbi:hypothetical protein HMN09_00000100 [Mycena chlorophos]|uniref:Cupin type-2 domain-containing protein n=1 Tax=Mycena chlorophos TaxID=658473 RepID=A0A8H6WPE0_MYCCL|nr:hypothetical protein HMN09_00000100 [Mycena chlorophos]
MASSTATQLPDIRLVATGHDPDGASLFAFDNRLEQFAPFGTKRSRFTNIHITSTVPALNTAPFPVHNLAKRSLPSCPTGGVLFCATDIPPGGGGSMHRNSSMDYAVVLSGEIVLVLDGGEEKTLKEGDVLVQRGTNHCAWRNRTKDVCRVLVVRVSAEKIVLENGMVLEETVFGKKP